MSPATNQKIQMTFDVKVTKFNNDIDLNVINLCLAFETLSTAKFTESLPCNGSRCNTCGRCRDWRYTGRPEDWIWIRNIRNWTEKEVRHWRSGNYRDEFELRHGATCTRSIHYRASYVLYYATLGTFDGSLLVRHLCSCAYE